LKRLRMSRCDQIQERAVFVREDFGRSSQAK
jgi:hypothetical protein